MIDTNPFFADAWTTPHGLPPFDRIDDAHFMPAFRQAMQAHNEAVNAIAASPDTPTFANTIEAMERAQFPMQRVGSVFWNLASADSNDARQAIEREIGPLLAQHWTAIYTNKALFARVKALWEAVETLGLNGEQQQVLEQYHRGFVRSGAALTEAQIQRMKAINAELSTLSTTFTQNILADEKNYQLVLETEADREGLPPFVIEAAAQAGRDRGLPGKHVITLSRSSIEPFLTYSSRRDLREKVYKAYIARGEANQATDTRPLIANILQLREERARMLGFKTFADFRLDNTMAKTSERARGLLNAVWPHAKRKAEAERDALQAIAQREGLNEPIAAWDWHYLTEKRRKAEFDIDGAELKKYFSLDQMIEAAFDTATRLFGVTFRKLHGVPLYHPDVLAWEVRHANGEVIGLFLGDYYHRPSKRSGAWMSGYRGQHRLAGHVTPIIVNVMNFSKGAEGQPCLLSLDDARTLFHEFGHGLHGLLSNVTYPSVSGTAVDRDFVELPSQLYENWLLRPETLSRYALHVETGQPMPDDLLSKVQAQQTFNQGFMTVEYTASALFDMDAHEADVTNGFDADAFEARMRERIGVPAEIALRHRPTHFQHIFSDERYAAGYYTYLWAEVMEADAFDAFLEAGDVYDRGVAQRLYEHVYSAGGKVKPEEAYRAFRGHDPAVTPLMTKRGLIDAEAA